MTAKYVLTLIFLSILFSCSQKTELNKYLGQKIPIDKPEIFGEGIVSVDSTGEALISVTKNGLAIYFPRYFKDKNGNTNGVKSLYTRFDGTKWTELKLNDRKIFYSTPRFVNDTLAIIASNGCIWKSIKVNDSLWTEPSFIDSLDLGGRNGVTDWSITKDLKLFYVQNGDIRTIQILNGKLENDQKIQGFSDFKTRHIGVSPKGDYLICDGFMEDINNGWVDSFISFQKSEENWTFPVHLDSTINTKNQGNYLPRISLDGEVFFFSRQDSINYGDVYWMSTKGLEKYRAIRQ